MQILLVHPPLLSAVVWHRLAPLLQAAGHRCTTPEVPVADAESWWQHAASQAAEACPDAEVVLAHSGAGVLVPQLLQRLPSARAAILIDAVLPPAQGAHRTDPHLRRRVDDLAVDGVLPPWTSWWPAAQLAELVPDPTDRAALSASAPEVPERFYDVAVPVPAAWEPPARGYLRLSAAYEATATSAQQRGWSLRRLDGGHLDLLTRPTEVAAEVLHLLQSPPGLAS